MDKRYPKALLIFIALSLFALGTSYFVEYVLGIAPCSLCQWQRLPYFATILLALLGLCIPFKRSALRLIQICFLAGLLIASYHTSVQFGLTRSSCQVEDSEQKAPSWRILGLPPPLYNGVFSLIVLVSSQVFLVRTKKKP